MCGGVLGVGWEGGGVWHPHTSIHIKSPFIHHPTVHKSSHPTGIHCLQEEYDRKTDAIQDEYEAGWSELIQTAERVHQDRPPYFDKQWLLKRRKVQMAVRKLLDDRRLAEERRDLELLASSQAMLDKYPEEHHESIVWHDYVQESLDDAVELRERRDAEVFVSPVVRPPRQKGHVVQEAKHRYQAFFCHATGRLVSDGPPGTNAHQPDVPNSAAFDDAEWARFFLSIGGYGQPGQVDDEGWTPLMHAMQATVHWDHAWRCCLGLMRMMSDAGLRAKVTKGRMVGYSVFHMACNGSDRMFKRAHLVQVLISRNAYLESPNDKGLTPWLIAAGSGVVDTAMALSQAGCDIFATTPEGRTAADRCAHSSTQMLACPHVCEM